MQFIKCKYSFYNCRLVGDTLFGEFCWFNSEISGFVLLKNISKTEISGKWWYSKDLRNKARLDTLFLDENVKSAHKIVWTRVSEENQMITLPIWVKTYSQEKLYKLKSDTMDESYNA